MIDYEKLINHLNEEIDYHERQCNQIKWHNSPGFNQWLGGYDALFGLKEFLQNECLKKVEDSTRSENMSMPSACEHKYKKGICLKCGKESLMGGTF